MGIVLLWIVDGDALLQVSTSLGELSQPEQRLSQNVVATQEQRRIAFTLGQDQSCSKITAGRNLPRFLYNRLRPYRTGKSSWVFPTC